jgi:hypothetical protein
MADEATQAAARPKDSSAQVRKLVERGQQGDRQALAARNDGALTLDADDGRYTIPLGRVVYVKRFTREARLGFSSGS